MSYWTPTRVCLLLVYVASLVAVYSDLFVFRP